MLTGKDKQMFSNPSGCKATMPVILAAEQAIQPVTGGMYVRLATSNPVERFL